MQHVLWPTVMLIILAMVILSLWTAFYGLSWERETIDLDTGESIAFCAAPYKNDLLYAACIPIMIFTTGLATYMAWKTKDVDAAYSESGWIFTGILAQLQIVFISIPVVVILVDVSTDARHTGYSIAAFCWSMSILCVVMYPKYRAWWKAEHPSKDQDKRGSGAGGVHITGIKASGGDTRGSDARHNFQEDQPTES